MSADFEGELVVTDADVVTIGEIRAGADSLTLHLDTVGRFYEPRRRRALAVAQGPHLSSWFSYLCHHWGPPQAAALSVSRFRR